MSTSQKISVMALYPPFLSTPLGRLVYGRVEVEEGVEKVRMMRRTKKKMKMATKEGKKKKTKEKKKKTKKKK